MAVVIDGFPSMTLVTLVMVGAPSITLVTLVTEGWPSITRVTFLIFVGLSITRVTLVTVGSLWTAHIKNKTILIRQIKQINNLALSLVMSCISVNYLWWLFLKKKKMIMSDLKKTEFLRKQIKKKLIALTWEPFLIYILINVRGISWYLYPETNYKGKKKACL